MLARNIVEQRTVLLENLLPISAETVTPQHLWCVYIYIYILKYVYIYIYMLLSNFITHSMINFSSLVGMARAIGIFVCSQVIGTPLNILCNSLN